MSSPKHERDRAADALTERHVSKLRTLCDAERAARLTQWGTAGPGGLLAESHATTSVDCATPPQGVAVTGLRQGGDL